jgi:hypothetical protein
MASTSSPNLESTCRWVVNSEFTASTRSFNALTASTDPSTPAAISSTRASWRRDRDSNRGSEDASSDTLAATALTDDLV